MSTRQQRKFVKSNRQRNAQLPERPKEVTLSNLTVERGDERFHQRVAMRPQWTHSRSNLTALSHSHNLYFCALRDEVWVYEPAFPSHRLQTQPVLIIKPPPINVSRYGYLDPPRPDDINHLIVDFLGSEEILLFCSDCGDVWWYYVNQIWNTINHQAAAGDSLTRTDSVLKPFFAQSVGISAWGLSVHRRSRKVAVSSNTHIVTIYQLAINQEHEPWYPSTQVPHVFWQEAASGHSDSMPRTVNTILRLPDTQHNIPCVSFCNTDEDPDGRFLAVGDIGGRTILWDIYNKTFEYWTAHFCWSADCRCFTGQNFNNAVWGLYWLDCKAFLKYGRAPRTGREKYHDLSGQAEDTPTSSRNFGYKKSFRVTSLTANDADPEAPVGDTDDDIDSATDELLAQTQSKRKEFIWDYASSKDHMIPRSPFMWISSKQIALHQLRTEQGDKGTAVVMNDPMQQKIIHRAHFTRSYWRTRIDRMSLHAAIPELGVVVVASSIGRCAVLSLLQGDAKTGRPYYFYRIDWMLPTKVQEQRGHRPGHTLMGLAVGPIPGQLGPPTDGKVRTWRLMLQYSDFSVLSYELSRTTESIPELKLC